MWTAQRKGVAGRSHCRHHDAENRHGEMMPRPGIPSGHRMSLWIQVLAPTRISAARDISHAIEGGCPRHEVAASGLGQLKD